MSASTEDRKQTKQTNWLWWFPPARWLAEYRAAWLPGDIVAGITLAAYAIPVSLAYAGLAGLPPQVGIYGYLLGGLGYALLGACWLVRKCEAEVRDTAQRQIATLAIGVLAFLVIVFTYALAEHLPILQRWIDRPYLFIFPATGAFAAAVLAFSILKHNDYSNLETYVLSSGERTADELPPSFFGTQAQRRRWLKTTLYRLPGSSLLLFLYRYVFRLGFLDGIPGLLYCGFQAVQMFHTKAKIYELRTRKD